MQIFNTLITSAGRRVSLVRNFKETQRRIFGNSSKSKVYCIDLQPDLSAACVTADAYAKSPPANSNNYIDFVFNYCKEKQVNLIVPTIDTELPIFAKYKDEFKKQGINVLISNLEIVHACSSKKLTEILFQKCNLLTPKIYELSEKLIFPVFAKLDDSSRSVGAQIVYSLAQAKDLYLNNPKYIFQEQVKGEEFTVDFFVDKHSRLITVVPRKRIFVRDGEVNKAITVKNPYIINSIKELCMNLPGAYGCLNAQLFYTENKEIYFIEINPRFGGGYPLSYHAGADFAYYSIIDTIDTHELEFNMDWKDKTLMLRYDHEVIVHDSSV